MRLGAQPHHAAATTAARPGARAQTGPTHILRRPRHADGAAIHHLVTQCPPLDCNSVYAYLLLCEHFSETCVVAERDGDIEGFVSAYVPPGRADVLFVWQVAVHENARGCGLGRAMLQEILGRPVLDGVAYLETTVGPGNAASRRMFAGLARQYGAGCDESPLFDRRLFGASSHDEEMLLRIGPLGERA